jgi:hypothetical protein
MREHVFERVEDKADAIHRRYAIRTTSEKRYELMPIADSSQGYASFLAITHRLSNCSIYRRMRFCQSCNLARLLRKPGWEIKVNTLTLRFEDEFARRQKRIIGVGAIELFLCMAIFSTPTEAIEKQLVYEVKPSIRFIPLKAGGVLIRPCDQPFHLRSTLFEVHSKHYLTIT